MIKDEVKDIIELNYDYNREWLIDYVYKLYQEREKYKNALDTSRKLLENSISKDRYNDIVRKYNKEVKKNEKLSTIKNR